jgi:hypothetical protein
MSDPAKAPGPPAFPAADGSLTLHTTLLGDLVVPGGAARAAELRELAAQAAVYATRAHGPGTRRAYRSAWSGYERWCRSLGREPLSGDAGTLALYATACASRGLSPASLRVHLVAIQVAHRLTGIALDPREPRLAMVLEGIVRSHGTRPRRRAAAAGPDALRLMLAARPPGTIPLGARDRALLLLGFGAALRRSELVGLALGDVEVVPGRGLRVLVRRGPAGDPPCDHGQVQPAFAGPDIRDVAGPLLVGTLRREVLVQQVGRDRPAMMAVGGPPEPPLLPGRPAAPLPGEKSRGTLEDVPLLAEDFVLPPQPLQLGRNLLLPRAVRRIDLPVPAPADPPHQRRQTNPQILGDLTMAPTARPDQPDCLVLKFLREPSLLRHGVPLASSATLHFSEASPPCAALPASGKC